MNHARFLASYHAGDYQAALGAAIDFGMPHFIWGAIDRTAALAQLGLLDAARAQLTRLIDLNPHFVENPRWHLNHHIKHHDTLEHVLEGLRKAGLGSRSFPTTPVFDPSLRAPAGSPRRATFRHSRTATSP